MNAKQNMKGHRFLELSMNTWVVLGIVLVSAFFLYGNTTGFLGRQKDLVSGSRYRPLSIATFAIEKQMLNGYKPSVSHFINILLFGLTGFLIYLLLKKLIPAHKPLFEQVPLITTLLFIFHPIHTEVVANIKGRDEIMALLLSLAGCFLVIRYLETKRSWFLITGTLLWFLGLLSKENAIVFWILLPMMLFMAGTRDIKQYIRPLVAFSIAALTFLFIRHAVVGGPVVASGELMNNSFLQATPDQKYATIFYTLWKYIELLFFPMTLTFDYYPYHVPLVNWGDVSALLGFAGYTVLTVWLLLSFRKNFLVTFALTFYLLPLLPVSNLFFPIGTFMSERFVYFSSVGFCVLVAMGLMIIANYKPALRYTSPVLLGIVMVLYSFKVISRNHAWYNDYTLFTTDVKTSYNSAKSNCSAGGVLLESTDTIANEQRKLATINQSIFYLKRSVAIHPQYIDAWLLLGNAYFKKNIGVDSVLLCYSAILNMNPLHELAFQNMQALVNREKEPDTKIYLLQKMLSYQPNNYQVNYQLGKIYGKDKGDLDKSVFFLNKAVLINPDEKDAYLDLGVAYGLKRNYQKSAEMLQKALELDPNNTNIMMNLGVTYQNLGQPDKAAECFRKAGGTPNSSR